jgi:hypothetical protein
LGTGVATEVDHGNGVAVDVAHRPIRFPRQSRLRFDPTLIDHVFGSSSPTEHTTGVSALSPPTTTAPLATESGIGSVDDGDIGSREEASAGHEQANESTQHSGRKRPRESEGSSGFSSSATAADEIPALSYSAIQTELAHISQYLTRLLQPNGDGCNNNNNSSPQNNNNLFQQVCKAMHVQPSVHAAMAFYLGSQVLGPEVVEMKNTLTSTLLPDVSDMPQEFRKLPSHLKVLLFPIAMSDDDRRRMSSNKHDNNCSTTGTNSITEQRPPNLDGRDDGDHIRRATKQDKKIETLRNKVTQMSTAAFQIYSMRHCNQRGTPSTPVQVAVGVHALHHGVPERMFKMLVRLGVSCSRDHARKILKTPALSHTFGTAKRRRKVGRDLFVHAPPPQPLSDGLGVMHADDGSVDGVGGESQGRHGDQRDIDLEVPL